MANKKFRLGRKNRNIVSGILVCVAAIYAVYSYWDMPRERLNEFFLSTLLFFVVILMLAVAVVALFKGLGALKRRFSGNSGGTHNDSE